jgi:hypothetical protein
MTTIQRCSTRRVNSHSATYDSAFSDAAMHELHVARFPVGHSAICDCEARNGTLDAKDCGGVTVSGPKGNKVARFEGSQFEPCKIPPVKFSYIGFRARKTTTR